MRRGARVREPQNIVVGLATFRRPELLAGLLPRLLEQIEQAAAALPEGAELGIVVVDNDPAGSAREGVEAAGGPRARAEVESVPGTSSARNPEPDEAHAA